ncbi:hypothetical protein RBB78_05005 [Tunturiibacter empetritectus]
MAIALRKRLTAGLLPDCRPTVQNQISGTRPYLSRRGMRLLESDGLDPTTKSVWFSSSRSSAAFSSATTASAIGNDG